MKILILGGTGAMGRHLVNLLSNTNNDVYVTSRKYRQNVGNIQYIQGNAQDINFMTNVLENKYDVIIDFMVYNTFDFQSRMDLLLNSTKQYVFLSSARVYASSEEPINENTPRLLDVSDDERYLITDEYALYKAKQEDLLIKSEYRNWTIIRPYVTYGEDKLQLGILEKEYWLYRFFNNRKIVFPKELLEKKTTLTYGKDVAVAINSLLGNENAYGETYHITRNEPILWKDVLEIYSNKLENMFGKKPVFEFVDNDTFEKCYYNKYQFYYDRLYNREFDNSKISKFVDISKFTAPEDGLASCLESFCKKPSYLPINWEMYAKMDKITNEIVDDSEFENEVDKSIYVKHRYEDNRCGYTDEKNAQILIALLKEHGIRKIIASPGATNIAFVGSIQYDPFFEIYSCVDERSAAYMACGMAAESGEIVCLSCTGATSSRNYLPALTEAFYRKLPVLAITSIVEVSKVGHHFPQVIDRSNPPKDAVTHSVTLPIVKDHNDFLDCVDKVNIAILELSRNGGGPVHINLQTTYSKIFNVPELPKVNAVKRITPLDKFPELPYGRIGIFAGSHKTMGKELIEAIDNFCEANNAVVFCDHTSGYNGRYKALYALVGAQKQNVSICPDTLIYIGEITGDYYSRIVSTGAQIWRVSEDGKIRNLLGKTSCVFEMDEKMFFEYYSKPNEHVKEKDEYISWCQKQLSVLRNRIPELPFSNIWVASKLAKDIPENSVVHLGILNSLRAWNFFEFPKSVQSSSNVGGFGIDGAVSTLIGASLVNNDKLYYLVVGDLAFFYDMNSLGNRHIKNNVRILLINNGKGTEFRNAGHNATVLGNDADKYVAAANHFGNKSSELVKNYVQSLGFLYLSASNKEEFLKVSSVFMDKDIGDKPIVFEVFTDSQDESDALQTIMNLM